MKIIFNTEDKEQVQEVAQLLSTMGVTINPIGVEEPKTKKATPSVPKEEKPVEEPKKTPTKKPVGKAKSGITLANLKESAKNAVTRSSREDVKKAIGNYAEKLAEVSEEDYGKLYKVLQELGA